MAINIKLLTQMALYSFGNHVIGRIPINALRCAAYRLYGMKIGRGSVIHMGAFIERHWSIVIGDHTLINPGCTLDGRAGLTIGNNVDIAMGVALLTLGHDVQAADYGNTFGPVTIGDRSCIYTRALVLPGVTVGEGAVVGAGSVVTKDVAPYTIVAGNPAKPIGERSRDLTYKLSHCRYFH